MVLRREEWGAGMQNRSVAVALERARRTHIPLHPDIHTLSFPKHENKTVHSYLAELVREHGKDHKLNALHTPYPPITHPSKS